MSPGQPREPSWATARKKNDEHIEVQLSGPGRGFLLVGCFFFGRRTEEGARAGWGLQH